MGQRGVVVLERESLPGTGSTSRANGGIRAQFTTEVNVAMSLASMDLLDALEGELGDPPVYRKAGYLFVTGSAERLAALAEAAHWQRERGVAVEVLSAGQVRARVPWLGGAIAGGTFGARDGFIDPGRLCNFFLREATRAGARIRYGAEVTAIEPGFRLRTPAGEVHADCVEIGRAHV